MVRAVYIWLRCLAAATALSGTGVDGVAPGAVVSAVPAAPPTLALRRNSSGPLIFLPRPGRSRLETFLEAVVTGARRIARRLAGPIIEWFTGDESSNHVVRRLQPGTAFPCRPNRRPGEYGVILNITPQHILECVKVTSKEIFKVNHRIVDISFGKFGGLEVLMVSQRRGPVQYIEVVNQGDYAHYAVNSVPLKTFRDHSCLNRDMWCFVSQVKPVDAGFLVIDRHRIIHYNYTWLVEGSISAAEIPDTYVNHFGQMNTQEISIPDDATLKFPTAVAEYMPYNATHVSIDCPALAGVPTYPGSDMFEITPLIPHAWGRLLFVTDTGNHRVVMMNASNIGQFDYIGQFGITGKPSGNQTGFNWPWGVAVNSPAWEGRYEPAYANVLVVDRRNNRLVKLNLGYPLMECEQEVEDQTGALLWDEKKEAWMCRRYDKPRLYYSAEFGSWSVDKKDYNGPPRLSDPTNVAVYRHFVVVAEVRGNAITLLRIDHQPPYGLKFVTYFKPEHGNYMQGGMDMSPYGYVWYNYVAQDMKNTFSSMFLPEIIRESQPPNRYKEFIEECVNTTKYIEYIADPDVFMAQVQFLLNMSGVNYEFPDRPNYFDPFQFNKSNIFDEDLLNSLVYNYSMKLCEAPTTPTPPPFYGGNEEGWVIDGKSQSEFTRRSGSQRSSPLQFGFITCSVVALMLLVVS